jgi:predicted nucleotidyltransferase
VSEGLLDLGARTLGPLCEELVFLGGAAIYLWITDPAAPATRATKDVDVISAVNTRTAYYALGEQLRERGFNEASDSKVICRWNHKDTGLILDVMPQQPDVLGFTNEWYEYAIETSIERVLLSGLRIRAAAPPAIVATKLAAWKGRGEGDLLRSLDAHDVLILIDGRETLADELAAAQPELRAYVERELTAIVEHRHFS